MPIIIKKTFILTLILLLSFATPVMTPQRGSYDPLSPSLSPPSPSPESDLTPPPSPPADAPFAENVKSEERKESGSGGIVVGVVVALCVVVLGHLVGVPHNNHPIIQPNPQGNNPPEILALLRNIKILNSCSGLNCSYGDHVVTNRKLVVISNPTNAAMEPVVIDVTPDYNQGYKHAIVGFGGQNGHPELVKTTVMLNDDGSGNPTLWHVDVYSLSTGEWRNVYTGPPFELCKMECSKFCENGRVVYFRAYDISVTGYLKDTSNFFISFDLERGVFGKVPLPRSLVNTTSFIHAAKVNGSLGLLEYRDDGVYDVWAKRWGANDTFFWRICNYFGVYETFAKIGTINMGQLCGGYGAPVPEVELDVGIGGYLWWVWLLI